MHTALLASWIGREPAQLPKLYDTEKDDGDEEGEDIMTMMLGS